MIHILFVLLSIFSYEFDRVRTPPFILYADTDTHSTQRLGVFCFFYYYFNGLHSQRDTSSSTPPSHRGKERKAHGKSKRERELEDERERERERVLLVGGTTASL